MCVDQDLAADLTSNWKPDYLARAKCSKSGSDRGHALLKGPFIGPHLGGVLISGDIWVVGHLVPHNLKVTC